MVFQFAADALDVFAGGAQYDAVLDGTGAAKKRGLAFDRAGGNFSYQFHCGFTHRFANEKQHCKTVEASGAM
jgi:hypothetical protein